MKKLILLIILGIGVSLFAQRPTPDMLFRGNVTVHGSDTLLVDSLTGTYNTHFKLIYVEVIGNIYENPALAVNPKPEGL